MSSTSNKCKPTCYTFKTANNYYAYDISSGKTLSISKALFSYLQSDIEPLTPQVKQELEQFNKQYLLRTIIPEMREHPYTPYLKEMLNRDLSRITLQVTQNCNFRCTYCPYTSNDVGLRSHNGKRMSIETAKKAIDFAATHSVDAKELVISFYGGEPLLEFPLIKSVTEYAHETMKGKHVEFNFTSNASLLTDEMATFFEDNNFMLVISLDGPKKINDTNRKLASGIGSAFDATMNSIKNIEANHKKLYENTMFNMVMDPRLDLDDYLHLIDDYPFLQGKINVSLLNDDHMAEKITYSEAFSEKEIYFKFLELLNEIGRYPLEMLPDIRISSLSRRIEANYLPDAHAFSATNATDFPGGQCVPGAHAPMVRVDGTLVVCEKVNEDSKATCIGNVFDGFDYEQAAKVLNCAGLDPEECQSCYAFKFCNLCVNDCVDGDELTKEAMHHRCKDIKAEAAYKIEKRTFIEEANTYYKASLGGGRK